ncbi:MAG: LPS-assembly protein LptD [Bacteroidia bacterium]|nr:LPS-assembly protein LptD [Bacteroidia bacterium]
MFLKLLPDVFIILLACGIASGAYSSHKIRLSEPVFFSPDTVAKNIQNFPVKDSLGLSLKNLKDTSGVKKDTLKDKKKKSNAIDDPIKYNAKDSIRFDIPLQKVFLFGEAYIKYKDIELRAAYIELSLGDDVVYAKGVPDSAGKEVGRPVFKQTDQEFDAVEMTYNFKTKKGIIRGVVTKQEGSFLHSDKTKKQADDVVCLEHGKFTTCELPHPHFYISLSKAKVIPDDKIVSGPAYLVIEDVPVPLGIPFGFFPNKKGHASGVLIPEYGEEQNRGFFLRNGGWYFAINDYIDLSMTGDIYSKSWAKNSTGSYGLTANSNYRKRYKFGGSFYIKYNENVIGEKEDTLTYQKNKQFSINWSHSQDPKSRPNSTFAANVNVSSSAYDRYNATTYTGNMFTNQKQSNISYSRVFPNTPFSFSANLRHSQNSTDSTITLTLPDLNFNMNRIFPFRKKARTGTLKWYENIGITYSSSIQNKVSTKESKLFTNETPDRFQNGVLHSVPISTSIKAFKYFSVSPSVNYAERWYFQSVRKQWDPQHLNTMDTTLGAVVVDTVRGFNRVYDYNFSLSFSTILYGMYQFKKSPVKAIRHVMTPTVSLSYRPDFGQEKWGYYTKYKDYIRQNKIITDSVYRQYSIFENGIYGVPGYGKAGMINFSLGNNLEMKVKSKTDTIEGLKKVKIFDKLDFATSYNLAADSMPWKPLSIRGNTNLFKMIDILFNATVDPYAYDTVLAGYTRINEFERDKSGDWGRITDAGVSVGASFHSSSKNKPGTQVNKDKDNKDKKNPRFSEDGYSVCRIPWNLSISYNLRYDKPYNKDKTTQTMQISGDFYLTPKWQIRFRTDYDFESKKLVNASIDIHRNLHCWEMSFNWVPFGHYQSYFFRINVKSSILQDLKIEKRRSWMDNLNSEQY